MKAVLRLVQRAVARIAEKRRVKMGLSESHYPHFFWSSLMEDRGGCDLCPLWSGRWWLSLTDRHEVKAEWHWFRTGNCSLGAQVRLWDGDSEDGIMLHVGIPWLCSIYLGVEGVLKYRRDVHMGSEYGVKYLFSRDFGQWGCLSLQWNAHDRWDNKKVFQISKHWDPCDFLFGKQDCTVEQLRGGDMKLFLIWQGEREEYDATATVERRTWKRKRDPFGWLTRSRIGVDIDIPQGIPEPGKGENSWDCGDDATYGIYRSMEGTSDEHVLLAWQKAADRILQTRLERGGPSWRPKKGEVKV